MRELSVYEASIVSRTEHEIYFNYTVAADYKTVLSKDLILKTLTILCNKYPQFSLHIDNSVKGKLPICSYLKNWDLSQLDDILDIYENESIDSIISKYNNKRLFNFNDLKPLWKIALLKDSNTLFFLMDHTFFDGTAAKNFHYQFANNLNFSSTINSFIIDTTKFIDYPDPTVLMGFDSNFKPKINNTTIELPTLLPPFDNLLMKLPLPFHNSTLYHISAKNSKKLIEISRLNDVKLTALLYAIASKSIVQIPHLDKDNTLFKTMIPINTRPLVKSLNSNINTELIEFGLFFGKYFHLDNPLDILNNSIKEISNYFQAKLNENLSHAMDDFQIFEFKGRENPLLVDESLKTLYDRNNSPKTTLVMSNLGMIKSNEIGKVYFDQPMVDACFGLHFISSSESGICINFTSHRAVKKEDYLTYIENTKKFINELIETPL